MGKGNGELFSAMEEPRFWENNQGIKETVRCNQEEPGHLRGRAHSPGEAGSFGRPSNTTIGFLRLKLMVTKSYWTILQCEWVYLVELMEMASEGDSNYSCAFTLVLTLQQWKGSWIWLAAWKRKGLGRSKLWCLPFLYDSGENSPPRHLPNQGPLEGCDKKCSMWEHGCASYLWQSPSCCQNSPS